MSTSVALATCSQCSWSLARRLRFGRLSFRRVEERCFSAQSPLELQPAQSYRLRVPRHLLCHLAPIETCKLCPSPHNRRGRWNLPFAEVREEPLRRCTSNVRRHFRSEVLLSGMPSSEGCYLLQLCSAPAAFCRLLASPLSCSRCCRAPSSCV